MKKYILPVLAVAVLMGSCKLTDVENPRVTEDRFIGSPRSAVEWTFGVRRQMSVTVSRVTEFTEIASDNYFNNSTQSTKVFDIPQINYFDQDVANMQTEIHKLIEMSEFGLSKVLPADEGSTALQRAELLMDKAYGHLLAAELFRGMPAKPLGEVLTPANHFQLAITLLNESEPLFTAANDKYTCALLKARAYYGLGDAAQARAQATIALQNPLLLAQVKYGTAKGPSNSIQGYIFTTGGTNAFAPLPRLDFLEPKYFHTTAAAVDDQKPISIAKAEEAYLIIAEAMAAASDLTGAKQMLKDLLTNTVSKRAVVNFSDKAETRNGTNRNDYPLVAVKVKFDASSPEKEGYVLDRKAGNINISPVSGTKVTATEIDAASTQDDMLYLIYLMRQEIFFTEGRRFSDLGIRFPVSEREQQGNPNVSSEDTKTIMPSFIPMNREMDDFEYNTTTGVVTMKHDMNRILIQNKTAPEVLPFIK